ncbi:MAG: Ku protein [Alphaproteobacteria bacterium 41-28]|nr:MAG: Ku protein [Alphaproteobacteria bacterium 41-28]
MATLAIWKGSINFGLVSIPVQLYSAVQPHVIGFKMLHSACNTPIANKRWCPHCNKEITWEEIVKGLKLPDGTYFVITKENLQKLRPEKTDTIEVVEFVDTRTVPPVYYDQHYFVIPQKSTNKAFFLLAAALKEREQSAVAQFVLRDKDYICLLQPYESGLLMTTLHYDYEIKHLDLFDKLKVPAKLDKQELKLAELLMSKLHKKKFDISHFKDTFAVRLAKAIKLKQKGKRVKIKVAKPATAPEISLMDALRASLHQHEKTPSIHRHH